MKKIRFLFMVSVFLTAIPLAAQTEEDAKLVAQKFLQAKKGALLKLSTVEVKSEVPNAAKAKGKNINASQIGGGKIFAFNADKGGFAVVCAGNGQTAIAGYSDKGKIEVDKMPEAMKAWLSSYASAMNNATTDATSKPYSYVGPTVEPVAPLIKTQWGQSTPFNGKCPSNGKQTAVAGCVPVALAQVLNYYHSDHKGTGELYYAHTESETEYNINYANVSYDWNNMLDTYDTGNYSQVQADAVAKLMLECGVASKAKYGYGETSASAPYVALNKYYGFDCTYLRRGYFVPGQSLAGVSPKRYAQPTSKWIKIIQDELTAGRPIIYTADNADDPNYGLPIHDDDYMSHCFIIDGIDADNYVHCNWGWRGAYDGYYDVAMLHPTPVKDFDYHHEMIVGIQPSQEPYVKKVSMALQPYNNYYFLYTNSYGSDDDADNDDDEDSSVGFSIVLAKEGSIEKVVSSYRANIVAYPYVNRYSLQNSWPINTDGLKDGVYQIRLAYKDSQSQYKLSPYPDALAPTVTIQNNGADVTFQGIGDDDLVNGLTIEDITPASEIYAGTTFYLAVKAHHGRSNDAYLKFRNMETGAVYGAYSGGESKVRFNSAYDDQTSTEIFKFVPKNEKNGFSMPAGRYKIELDNEDYDDYEEDDDVKLNGEYYIDVAERPTYPIMDGSDWCGMDFNTTYYDSEDYKELNASERLGYITVGKKGNFELKYLIPQYTYANKVEAPVTVKVYMMNVDTSEEIPVGIDYNWTPGKKIELNLLPTPLEGKFRFRSIYEVNGIKRGGLVQHKKKPYYNILHDSNTYDDICQLVSTKVVKENDDNHLQVVLKRTNQDDTWWSAYAKAIIYDKANDEISMEGQEFTFASQAEANAPFKVKFTTPLSEDKEYDVWLLTASREAYNKYFVTDDNGQIAHIHVDKDMISDISQVSLADELFSRGEQVKVYDLKGILIKNMAASDHMWNDLQNQLPSGIYILKSSKRTIKFKK